MSAWQSENLIGDAGLLQSRFPARCLSAAISNRHGFHTPGFFLDEARRLGLRILPLDINASGLSYHGKDDWIRPGLIPVGGCREAAMRLLIQEREANGPFDNLGDLLSRLPLHRREAGNLILAGGMDRFGKTRSELLRQLDAVLPPVGGGLLSAGPEEDGEFCLMRKCLDEQEMLGCAISADLRNAVEVHSSARGAVLATEIGRYMGMRVRVAGIPLSQRLRPAAPGGEPVSFLSLGDATGGLDVGFRARALERWGMDLSGQEPYGGNLVEVGGVVREAEGDPWVDAETIRFAPWSPDRVDYGIASRRLMDGLRTFPAYAYGTGSLAA